MLILLTPNNFIFSYVLLLFMLTGHDDLMECLYLIERFSTRPSITKIICFSYPFNCIKHITRKNIKLNAGERRTYWILYPTLVYLNFVTSNPWAWKKKWMNQTISIFLIISANLILTILEIVSNCNIEIIN